MELLNAQYKQPEGTVYCELVYLHANGEFEGFSSFGNTTEEAEENCVNRIKAKLDSIGLPFNRTRVYPPQKVKERVNSFEYQLILDDFKLSEKGTKL